MFKSNKEIISYIKKNKVEIINIIMTDVTGRLRQLSMPARGCDEEFLKEGFGFDASNYGYKTVDKSDMIVIPDITTAFIDPFRKARTITVFGEAWNVDGKEERFEDDLRNVARKTEEYVKELTGCELLLGPEYEFYIFDNASYQTNTNFSYFQINKNSDDTDNAFPDSSSALVKNVSSYHIASPEDRFADFRDESTLILEQLGVKIKYHHHEVGVQGQLEIETEFGTILKMADTSMLVKYVIKNLAKKYNMVSTFMPKPLYKEAGSGHHVHFKLIGNKKESHPFYDKKGYAGLSKLAHQFMAGILDHASSLAGLTNPSSNSYKRLVEGFEAPTAIAYALSNRSAAIRIPGYAKSESDVRFEYRPPDATANPYLAYSALVIAALDGVKRNLNPQKMGFGPYDTNLYKLPASTRKKIKWLPRSLDQALTSLKEDNNFLIDSGIFSKDLIDSWILMKTEKELLPLREMPHPMEFLLYFDL